MRRFGLVFVLALSLALLPLAVDAQSAGKVYRIGYLSLQRPEGDKSWVTAFRHGLRDLGFGKRLVTSLARPGGNITGLSDTHADLVPKRLQLLKEVVPSVGRVGVLLNPDNPMATAQFKTAQTAAAELGLTLVPVEVKGRAREDIDLAFSRTGPQRLGGLLVIGDPTVSIHRVRIAELAAQARLPAISTVREWAETGLLMAYGTNFHELWRRSATYVDKILKGAKPGDLPIEQPTKFELVINLKTAKALRLAIPQSVLVRSDAIIQ
jgi:putative tryptophan/tyrosine transport system substrate-binding protein